MRQADAIRTPPQALAVWGVEASAQGGCSRTIVAPGNDECVRYEGHVADVSKTLATAQRHYGGFFVVATQRETQIRPDLIPQERNESHGAPDLRRGDFQP